MIPCWPPLLRGRSRQGASPPIACREQGPAAVNAKSENAIRQLSRRTRLICEARHWPEDQISDLPAERRHGRHPPSTGLARRLLAAANLPRPGSPAARGAFLERSATASFAKADMASALRETRSPCRADGGLHVRRRRLDTAGGVLHLLRKLVACQCSPEVSRPSSPPIGRLPVEGDIRSCLFPADASYRSFAFAGRGRRQPSPAGHLRAWPT